MNRAPRGFYTPFSAGFSFVARLCDAVIIIGSLYGLMAFFDVYHSPLYQYAALVSIILYFLTAEIKSTFRSSRLENYGDIAGKVFFPWVLTSIALLLLGFISKTSIDFSRLTIVLWLLGTPILLTLERILVYTVLRRLRTRFKNTLTYAILGDTVNSRALTQQIETSAWTGLKLAGKYDELNSLLADLENQRIDYIFINYAADQKDKIIAAVMALKDETVSTYLVPDLLVSDLLGSQWIMLGNTPLVIVNDSPSYEGYWLIKRIEDIVLGFLILLAALPIMCVIALFIKLDSPGPVLFRQRRHGLNGEVIKVMKFRTMRTLDDGEVVNQATQNDPRVTSVGKFLRRTSLDELPQFFNVIQGNMSIVGPRPHAVAHNDYYRKLIDGYMQRHKVKPGITGWAQVNGMRGETDTIEKMQGRVDFDIYYINHWSLVLDLKIIFLTIIAVVGDKKAY
jgi:putative colanic acid biosynthesis UDP-glucose lipid carrier transferase